MAVGGGSGEYAPCTTCNDPLLLPLAVPLAVALALALALALAVVTFHSERGAYAKLLCLLRRC